MRQRRLLSVVAFIALALWPVAARDDAFIPGYEAAPLLEPRADLPTSCDVDGWWSYNPACCCTHGWCAPIPCRAVSEESGGYVVRLAPGMHPRVHRSMTVLIPRGDAKASPDGRCHVCAFKHEHVGGGAARCLLVPPGAM